MASRLLIPKFMKTTKTKTSTRKLTLNKTTIKTLSAEQIAHVAGGISLFCKETQTKAV